MAGIVSIKANCADVINYARFQNGMRVINRIVIKNTCGEILTNLVMTVESDPAVFHDTTVNIGDIKADGTLILDDVRVDISSKFLADLTEIQKGTLRITVRPKNGEFEAVTYSHGITVLPYDQWEGVINTDELLASFCVPNHPDIKHIIQAASWKMLTWTGDSSMDGYNSGDRERVKLQAAAIFEVIKEKGISYTVPPATFYESGQRIRMPEEIFSIGLATCMDTSMLYASCLESVGLRPLIILNKTHAYIGLWLDDESTSPYAVNDDPTLLRKRNAVGINQMMPVETTYMDSGIRCSFDEAIRKAEILLANPEQFECYIDIHEARKLGVYPLPLRVRTPDGYKILPLDPTGTNQRPESLSPCDIIDMESTPVVSKQVIWERKLLDLTLRNNLINIHPRSILQIMNPEVQILASLFENGHSMGVYGCPEGWSGQFETPGIYAPIPHADKMGGFASDEAYDGKLHCFIDNERAEERIEYLRQTSKRTIEENGANTLFLTIGALKWKDQDRKRDHISPIILIPCEIIRKSGQIVATGEEPAINLTLLEMLRENFGIIVSNFESLPQKDGHTDVQRVLNTIRKSVMNCRGWDVEPLVFLGNFTFNKFIIWNDVHTGRDIFGAHPVIDGFKKGSLSEETVVSMSSVPCTDDNCPPKRILLPISADSSQMKAIRDSLDGKSFVMQGPPGTGKSQTITNIIANAIYHGKRVLFVSEKKAALEVVQKRLASIGLEPFCLELYSNKAVKSLVLAKMEETLNMDPPTRCPSFSIDADNVGNLRSELNEHIKALHGSSDSGITLYDALSHYISSDSDIQSRRVPNAVIASLSPESIVLMQAAVKDYASVANRVPLKRIKNLLDLPLNEYTPTISSHLDTEFGKILATNNPFLFRIRSNRLQKLLGPDLWRSLGLKSNASRREKLDQWRLSIDGIRDYAIYNSRRTFLRSHGLGIIAEEYEKGNLDVSAISDFFMKSLYRSYTREALNKSNALSMFSGDLFNNKISDYRKAEQKFNKSCQQEICNRMYSRLRTFMNDAANPEFVILKKAIKNGARGMSLRTLFSKIPHALPNVCPCMLMSPLSVSQYLSAQAEMFDIVIFDEASQMQTCEAVASIGRGRSLIVAGDPKQLPPTTFFETLSFDDENVDHEDMESVLEDCISLSVPSNTLRWHYRSHHESLIAFSNSKYYENSLLTFPSNDDLVSKVTLEKINGIYDRGYSRQNKKEAEAVVSEIKRRLENTDGGSIGVITFSLQQQIAIEKQLDNLFRQNPQLAQVAANMEEPIFIKNLENVQGDERDIILFSVGYGVDKNGRLPMNFGPLNQHGGWRRLNVAVSRARREMKVFSSMRPEDFRIDYNTPLGVIGLRDFLRYAEQGRFCLEHHMELASEHDVWVEKIAKELRDEGLVVNTNVGSSDFRIDIAVVDKEKEGFYSYGIICDGLNYASSSSAVDREIVRPEILEKLGWKIERRWILDELYKIENVKL